MEKKKLPTRSASAAAEAAVTAYREQGHYQPGLVIADPCGQGPITLADPSVVANWEPGCKYRNYARFEYKSEIYEYSLREVAHLLRVAASDSNDKGRLNRELDDAADPLGDDEDDHDGDGEHDAGGELESEAEAEPRKAHHTNKGKGHYRTNKGKGRYHSDLDTDGDSDSSDESEGDYHDSGAE